MRVSQRLKKKLEKKSITNSPNANSITKTNIQFALLPWKLMQIQKQFRVENPFESFTFTEM